MLTPKAKILFFGEDGDTFSARAYAYLAERGFKVRAAFSSRGARKALSQETLNWNGDYILCFRCYNVLPETLLERAGTAALNFHPAPPEYPGSGSCNWALYNGDLEFGVTLHHMNGQIDASEIIEVRRFPILAQENLDSLVQRSREHAYDFFIETVDRLSSDSFDFHTYLTSGTSAERWAGKARRIAAIDKLQRVSPDISEKELARIIRATHTKKFPVKLILHGRVFRLED